MYDDAPGSVGGNDPDCPSNVPLFFDRFLRRESAWSWRAWIFFCSAMVLCTTQAVPSWTHPDWHWHWHPSIYYGIIAICGAATGFVIARYRWLGLLAGILAGIGSVLAAVLILEPIHSFSRIVFAMVGIMGLLPGVALYCIAHVVIDRLRGKPSERI